MKSHQLAIAVLFMLSGTAQAIIVDSFDAAPDGEFARLIEGDPADVDVFVDGTVLGGERETALNAIGGIAIASFGNDALQQGLLGSTLIDSPLVQNILRISYDGGAQGLAADLTDGGQSDRFIISGSLEFGVQVTNPSAPVNLLAAAQITDTDANLSTGGEATELGPVFSSNDPADPLALEILFSSLTSSTAGPADLGSVAMLAFILNFSGAAGSLSIDNICTGNASGCVETAGPGNGPAVVPLPASVWMMMTAIGVLGWIARRRVA